MTSAIESSLSKSRALINRTKDYITTTKAAGGGGFLESVVSTGEGMGSLSNYRDQAKNRSRYAAFRGWVYSAVNALASEAAAQPVTLIRKKGKGKGKPKSRKYASNSKAAKLEEEIIEDHPLLDRLRRPNDLQYQYQFVYSFIASLYLTGWSFILKDEVEGEDIPRYYALPTTWVKPIHDKGPFAEFKIVNPNNPLAEGSAEVFTREQIAFAHFPNPADPLSAYSPVASQETAIGIDDKIQACQTKHFDNGIFPSVVVTVGKTPHPDVPAGLRPRLTATQRRQVYAAIKKVSGGVANYGNPAIVDGLIESITKFSSSQEEIGWEKSEETVKKRIYSAFCVHPFITGEQMPGSYAQAAIVGDRFGKRLNIPLSLLSLVMTEFCKADVEEDLEVEYEPYEVADPQMVSAMWDKARANNDVSQNEYRTQRLGLPPDEDSNQSYLDKSSLTSAVTIAEKVTAGAMTPEQGMGLLVAMGLPTKVAEAIVGDGPPEPVDEAMGKLGEAVDGLGQPVQIDDPTAMEEEPADLDSMIDEWD